MISPPPGEEWKKQEDEYYKFYIQIGNLNKTYYIHEYKTYDYDERIRLLKLLCSKIQEHYDKTLLNSKNVTPKIYNQLCIQYSHFNYCKAIADDYYGDIIINNHFGGHWFSFNKKQLSLLQFLKIIFKELEKNPDDKPNISYVYKLFYKDVPEYMKNIKNKISQYDKYNVFDKYKPYFDRNEIIKRFRHMKYDEQHQISPIQLHHPQHPMAHMYPNNKMYNINQK